MNQHLTQLEAVTEPRLRPDQKRVYYNGNMLFIDFKKLGLSRDSLVKASKPKASRSASGIIRAAQAQDLFRSQMVASPASNPAAMPGNDYVNGNHIFLPVFYADVPDLIAQYVKAFQKVWAHRPEVAKL